MEKDSNGTQTLCTAWNRAGLPRVLEIGHAVAAIKQSISPSAMVGVPGVNFQATWEAVRRTDTIAYWRSGRFERRRLSSSQLVGTVMRAASSFGLLRADFFEPGVASFDQDPKNNCTGFLVLVFLVGVQPQEIVRDEYVEIYRLNINGESAIWRIQRHTVDTTGHTAGN